MCPYSPLVAEQYMKPKDKLKRSRFYALGRECNTDLTVTAFGIIADTFWVDTTTLCFSLYLSIWAVADGHSSVQEQFLSWRTIKSILILIYTTWKMNFERVIFFSHYIHLKKMQFMWNFYQRLVLTQINHTWKENTAFKSWWAIILLNSVQ